MQTRNRSTPLPPPPPPKPRVKRGAKPDCAGGDSSAVSEVAVVEAMQEVQPAVGESSTKITEQEPVDNRLATVNGQMSATMGQDGQNRREEDTEMDAVEATLGTGEGDLSALSGLSLSTVSLDTKSGSPAPTKQAGDGAGASTTADTGASTTADTGAAMTADTGASTTADTGAAMTADTGAAMTADNVGPIPSALLTIPARPPMRQGAQVFNSVTEQWVEHYDEQSPENDFVSSTPANDHIEVSTVEGNVFSPLPDTMSSPKPLDHTNVQAPSTRVQASRSVKRGLPLDDGMSSDLGEDEYGKDARGRTILESTEDGDTDDLADEVVSDTDVVVPPIVSARRKRAASSNRKTKGGGKSEKARGKEKAVDTDADVEDNGTGEATSGGSNDVMLGEWMGKLQSFKDQLELNADGLSKGQEWKKGPLSKDGQQLVFELLELFDGTLNTLSRVVEKPPEVLLGYMGFTANGYRNINSFNIHQHKYKHDPETAKKQDETAAAWKKRCKKEYNKIEAKLDEEGYTAKEKRDYWFKVAQEQPMGTNDEQIWSGANTKKQLLRMTEGLSKQSAAYGRLLRVHVMGVVCYVGSALSGGNQFFQTWGNTPETQEFIELNGVYMKDFSMYMRTVFSIMHLRGQGYKNFPKLLPIGFDETRIPCLPPNSIPPAAPGGGDTVVVGPNAARPSHEHLAAAAAITPFERVPKPAQTGSQKRDDGQSLFLNQAKERLLAMGIPLKGKNRRGMLVHDFPGQTFLDFAITHQITLYNHPRECRTAPGPTFRTKQVPVAELGDDKGWMFRRWTEEEKSFPTDSMEYANIPLVVFDSDVDRSGKKAELARYRVWDAASYRRSLRQPFAGDIEGQDLLHAKARQGERARSTSPGPSKVARLDRDEDVTSNRRLEASHSQHQPVSQQSAKANKLPTQPAASRSLPESRPQPLASSPPLTPPSLAQVLPTPAHPLPAVTVPAAEPRPQIPIPLVEVESLKAVPSKAGPSKLQPDASTTSLDRLADMRRRVQARRELLSARQNLIQRKEQLDLEVERMNMELEINMDDPDFLSRLERMCTELEEIHQKLRETS